ncbi:MAG: nitronate monooxygenase [Flavobacteriales bacterium]|nr:nitronate monooxygenase [Flavobacteriaceae bacterium]PHX93105.1 MAG: nitronate monooxygenase [Flavobacteriales bacterium]
MKTRITELFGVEYPIIQGGMIWCSGWKLASAVSNAGGLGLIGSGSMYPGVLKTHIQRCKQATNKPFGVNIPLMYPEIDKHLEVVVEEGVKIIFTSAGNPLKYTSWLKDRGITVVHVVANVKFTKKCEEAGVDAIVAEGFEAGGHNGKEETTTLCLLPLLKDHTTLPIIAAGGIGCGRSMAAAFCLGADGVQVGSRFAASIESSAHEGFKQEIIRAGDGATQLTLKEITPVRVIKNAFFEQIQQSYREGADIEKLKQLLGHGRAKKGMFEGQLSEGELEIGQIAARISEIESAQHIVSSMVLECLDTFKTIHSLTK